MAESAEGIGGRKWSFQTGTPPASHSLGSVALYLSQGKYKLAMMMPQETEADATMLDIEKVENLLVTAPQLWDAANEYLKALRSDGQFAESNATASLIVLEAMVAKSVGKTDWNDVKQR